MINYYGNIKYETHFDLDAMGYRMTNCGRYTVLYLDFSIAIMKGRELNHDKHLLNAKTQHGSMALHFPIIRRRKS